ncbi:Stromal cell-derived factor 2-like protein 1 [Mortierella sp. AD094]|nr:Stromal cell-derived factor 2-like protein 1 [Mortierella sp. AD094]
MRSPPRVQPHDPYDDFIRFGSRICLRHMDTGGYLRTPNLRYKTSMGQSGQFVVYGVRSREPAQEDWWDVTITKDEKEEKGERDIKSLQEQNLRYGSRVRLFNVANRRWLHSHKVKSPVSYDQQEVSAFGSENDSDDNDIWVVEKAEDGADFWRACDVFFSSP